MPEIIMKLISILFPAFLGYFLKKVGIFGPKDYTIVTRLMLFVTMPAVVISSFSGFSMNVSMLGVPALGLSLNLMLIVISLLITIPLRGKLKDRELLALMICGFNMGNFVIPFVKECMGLESVAVASLFDTGNTIMCLGGNYIIISSILDRSGERITVKRILKKLFGNPILPTYLTMAVLSLAGVRVPETVTTLLKPLADANTLVATFVLGLMMEIKFSKEYLGVAGRILGLKYLLDACIAVGIFFLIPFDPATKRILICCAFAPIPGMSPIFAEEMGCDVNIAGFTGMVSTVLSCAIIPILAGCMGMLGT